MPFPATPSPTLTPEQYAAYVAQQGQAGAGQAGFNFSEFVKSKGLDPSQIAGGEQALADALIRAAQGYMQNQDRISEQAAALQAAQQSAQQSVAMPATNAAEVNVDQWSHLLVESNGRIEPKQGAIVPWQVVQQAQSDYDARRENIQSLMRDPENTIRKYVGGEYLDQQVQERFERMWAERQRQQEVESWLAKHDNVIYHTGPNGEKQLTPEGQRLSEIVDDLQDKGIKPEHIFATATRDLERELLQSQVEEFAQQQWERQQAQAAQRQFSQPAGMQQYGSDPRFHPSSNPLQQYQPQPVHPSQRDMQGFQQSTGPQSPQPTFFERHVGNPGGEIPPGAWSTTSRDSGPTSARSAESSDFQADDPESIARSVATESGFMNGSGDLN